MAVHVRLRRMGAKKQAFYRIVAADSRRARDGRFLETLGTYNPITKPAEIKLHEDKLTKWLDQGAIPSDTVGSLLTQVGFIEKYEKQKKGEDVSEITVKTTIKERPKKTRKMKKAAIKIEEEAKAKKVEEEAEAKRIAAEKAKKAAEEAEAKKAAEAEAESAEKADDKPADGAAEDAPPES